MSSPVSIQDGPFATNTLISKKFLLIHIFVIWGSILPIIIELYFFWKIVEYNSIFLYLLLPLQICISYLILIIDSTILSRILLAIFKFIHQPKEGIFNQNKSDRDYYFWSLRAVSMKWPIWLSNLVPSSFIKNLMLKILGIKTDYSNKISSGNIDVEFVELGKNIIIGQGCSIKSSMILQGHLIIKKVIIEDNVIIGSNSFIAPGTHISSNMILEAMSLTKFHQFLEPNSSQNQNLLEEIQRSPSDFFLNLNELKNNSKSSLNPEDKFVKNLTYNISTFGFIYFCSNFIPVLGIIFFCKEYFFPFYLSSPNFFQIHANIQPLLILLITPLFLVFLTLINLFTVILITKVFYKVMQYKKPAIEGSFHWNNKNQDFKSYFKRSFILRFAKWKIQKSPFPWLIKPAFNFIGNCCFGKKTVIENSYLAKEFLKVGENSYIGKTLLANHLWDKNLTIKSITIGENVSISDNCCIAPGTEIKNDVSLLPLSVTSKSERLTSSSAYFDSPIKRIPEVELIRIINYKLGDNCKD
ncbi:MAG: hypothetical protein ACFFAI_04010 [Promethearchaeota archaeon]